MTPASPELLATLHALLDLALELEPPARERWLEELRRERPEHAAELERLLADETSLDARRFLSDRLNADHSADAALPAGMRLGRGEGDVRPTLP